LPIEYTRRDWVVKHGRAINASEGGLLVYFPEQMEIGQHLRMNLFLPSGSELNVIEIVNQVVWMNIHLGKGLGDYQTGVRFMDISSMDLNRLKHFLGRISE
jgi:c-di-GMP-binding flagellar brake protein YcgR